MEEYAKQTKPNDEYSDIVLTESMENLKAFMGDFMCSEEVIKLALKKCKLNLEEAIFMVTDPDKIADLEEEQRRDEDAREQA